MIGTHSRVPVFAYCQPADMRKGFEGLSALVRRDLGRNPIDGSLYLFTNRRRRRAKVLYFDGTGLCVLANQPSSHYTSFDSRRGSWSSPRDARCAAARSRSRSQRLQCFSGWVAGSS